MIDANARPLPQHRLSRLVHGLRNRLSGKLRESADEVEQLKTELAATATRSQEAKRALQTQHAQLQQVTTTDWDEANNTCWDQAEMQCYQAIFGTQVRHKQLKTETAAKIQKAKEDAQAKTQEVERKFLASKEKPLNRLRNFRKANHEKRERLDELERAATNALTQRSLAIPSDESSVEVLAQGHFENSNEAYRALEQQVVAAETQCRSITHNKLAQFFESGLFWGLCVFVFAGAAAVLFLSGLFEPVITILAAAGVTAAFLLVGFVGIRPWLKRAAQREYPKLLELLTAGRATVATGEALALQENEAELARLAEKRDERARQVRDWCENQIFGYNQQLQTATQQLLNQAAAEKLGARNSLTDSLARTAEQFRQRIADESGRLDASLDNCEQNYRRSETELESRMREIDRGAAQRIRVTTNKAAGFVAKSQSWCDRHFADWEILNSSTDAWPPEIEEPILPLGEMAVRESLPEVDRLDLQPDELAAPLLFSAIDDEYLVIHGDPAAPHIRELVRHLLLRALTALPAGRTQVCVIDPPGLGRDFGWLMHLGDFDPELVSHRVWTQTPHIVKQLGLLERAAEDFIQQSLRNQYQTIVEFNRDAGALAEPFRILVWSSAPAGMDEQSWKSLRSLLDSGARCGVIPILVVDPDQAWPYSDQRELLMRRGLHVQYDADKKLFSAQGTQGKRVYFQTQAAPSDNLAQELIQEVGRRSIRNNRIEVPLEKMVPAISERWQGDSSHFLEIPIGQSGIGRTHSLKLGIGTAQHAIIAGKTGSGKSSLLHAMITSALLKYSPKALRLVLLDFKKGVEFQVYSDAQIPHADIIGIESHREFGLSALQHVDECMQRRGEAFRAAGVQDIASWNATRPDDPMPRMLLVIDEFQELFVEDDKLSSEAQLLLDRIVRQGRSFGVHSVMSSQTLAGAYSLPRTTLGQMAVRIALQCDAADAQIVFADDNPAAARLKHPGQAVYNDAGGRIEGNQPMQIGWLPKAKQVEWFEAMPRGYQNDDATTNRLGRSVVYDGNRAAIWDSDSADMALRYARQQINPEAIWCVVGESVAISPAVAAPLTRQAGRNALVVGANDPQAAATLDAITASFVKQAGGDAVVFAIQGAKPTDARAAALTRKWNDMDCEFVSGDIRAADEIIDRVYKIVSERVAGDGDESGVLLNLIQLGRLRSLKKEDDFASFGETEKTPDKQLEEILRDGPSVGVHVVAWAENYSTVNRWLSRSALREIELRLLMQMSANDSTNLVDSISASKLGEHVMLLFDEATGIEQRFRPFAIDNMGPLIAWSAERS